MANESNDLSVYIIFQNMEKELREDFEGLDMYFGYHDDDYEDISAFNMPDITIYYAGAKLEIYHDDDIDPIQMQFECLNASTKSMVELGKILAVVGKYLAEIDI